MLRQDNSPWRGYWPRSRGSSPSLGTRRLSRLRENADATAVGLSADERADLDALAARVGVAGDRYGQANMNLVGR